MIPVMPEPTVPRIPLAPNLAELYPPILVTTREEAQLYMDACDDYELGEFTTEELLEQYGLSRSAACEWAIYGHTVQGSLTVESIFVQQADYVELLRSHIETLTKLIQSQYDLSLKTQETMKTANERPPAKDTKVSLPKLF